MGCFLLSRGDPAVSINVPETSNGKFIIALSYTISLSKAFINTISNRNIVAIIKPLLNFTFLNPNWLIDGLFVAYVISSKPITTVYT